MGVLKNVTSAEEVPGAVSEAARVAEILKQGTRVDAAEFLKMLMSRDEIERVMLSADVSLVAARNRDTNEWFLTDKQRLMEAGAVQEVLTTQ